MHKIRLGRTGLGVSSVGFGVLPLQRRPMGEAVKILRHAYDAGVNYYDTARAYSDSEEKIGAALSDVRQNIIIATKTKGESPKSMQKDLETSLKNLKTDYIDVYQLHNPVKVPMLGDGSGVYEFMSEAKKAGKIRHIGITTHPAGNAVAAIESGLYETLQHPFSILSTGKDLEIPALCEKADMGFIAMKGLGGGLVRNIPAAFAFMRLHANVVPIWGVQFMEELEQFLSLDTCPPIWNEELEAAAEADREELGKEFCRGCGYCHVCPEKINIAMVARMRLFLNRSPWRAQYTPQLQEEYGRAANCTKCGLCAAECPYGLDTPKLVEENYKYYLEFWRTANTAFPR